MSTPTQPLPGTEVRTEIAKFVAGVERELDDLPRDDAGELTDGLEADLNEAWAAEGVRPGQRFGTPASYAAELRAAAGLPPRTRRGINGPAVRLRWRQDREQLLSRLQAQSWWPQAVEYGRELRPAWWALRGATLVLLAAYVVSVFLGLLRGGLIVVLLVPLVIWGAFISMRAGAADLAPSPKAHLLLAAANVVTVGCLAVAGIAAFSGSNNGDTYYYDDASNEVPGALTANGETVSNVFAYDAAGKPITRFRLYDQAGRPLVTDEAVRTGYDDSSGDAWLLKPDSGAAPPEWNLFPLLKVTEQPTGGTDADGNDVMKQVVGPVVLPYAQMPALPSSTTPTASAEPSSSTSPSTASPSPTSPSSPSSTSDEGS